MDVLSLYNCARYYSPYTNIKNIPFFSLIGENTVISCWVYFEEWETVNKYFDYLKFYKHYMKL